MGDEAGVRLVKRYPNRKLYDLTKRHYVTLEGLQRLVGQGEEVKVVDQKTGQDVTSLTLAQILLEGLRQRTAQIPRPLLVQLVRLTAGPDLKPSAPSSGGLGRAREEAEKIVRRLLGRGRLSLEEAMALRQEIVHSWTGLLSEAQSGLESGLHRLLGDHSPSRRKQRAPKVTKRGRTRPRSTYPRAVRHS
jgi:polyhydroxyalkanoate synthesis repressor PhaR